MTQSSTRTLDELALTCLPELGIQEGRQRIYQLLKLLDLERLRQAPAIEHVQLSQPERHL